MNKIILAFDSFKGSVSSIEIAQQAELAILEIFPQCEVIKVPIADGGEGTMEALISCMQGSFIKCLVSDPLERKIEGKYGILRDGKTAVIEMATVNGLHLIASDLRNPMVTTSFGTGQLIKDALLRGCENFLIGIGGSATCDAGTGMLQALGFRFLDKQGNELGKGGQILEHICTIDDSNVLKELESTSFNIACDVKNPFLGNKGAKIFAPQKGADNKMVNILDRGFKNFSEVIFKKYKIDIKSVPGSGAAGGLGGGFLAFLPSKLISGIEMMLKNIQFNEIINGADLIITGEGRLDKQTIMGKAPSGVLEAGRNKNIPVIALGGGVENADELNEKGFLAVIPILPFPVTIEKAMDREFTLSNIKRTLEQQLRIIRKFKME